MEQKKAINELRLNPLGKIFFTTLGAWLVGKAVNTKIRGSKSQVEALSEALVATKNFQEELYLETATVDSVVEKLNKKHSAAEKFEAEIGLPWPL